MDMRYQKLFEKGYIGGVESRNRVAMTAIGNGLASTEMTKEEISYILSLLYTQKHVHIYESIRV